LTGSSKVVLLELGGFPVTPGISALSARYATGVVHTLVGKQSGAGSLSDGVEPV